MQWGTIKDVLFDEKHYESATFKKVFPHKCFSVVATANIKTRKSNGKVSGLNVVYVNQITNTNVIFYPGYYNSESNIGDIHWIAIGY